MDRKTLAKYTGWKTFCCPWHQNKLEGLVKWLPKGGVDLDTLQNMLHIVPETAKYAYSQYTPTVVKYKPGTRPNLEAVATFQTASARTDEEKAMRLCEFLWREVCKPAPSHWEYGGHTYYGGTEEEVICRKTNICNDLARTFVALCQVLGIPARILLNLHVITEAYVNGAWAVFDLNYGLYHRKPNGRLASAWDICRDRSILERHPRYDGLSANYKSVYHKVNAIYNYFIWEKHPPAYLATWRRHISQFPRHSPELVLHGRSIPPCPVTGERDI